MEPRDQRQESHGVYVCNKCGWPFPNPHPSAKHRRAHRRVCGTTEAFKLVESEANTLLTISDDDGDLKSASPKVLGGSCCDKGVDGMKTKPKESEDDVFSDAVAEFSDGVGPNKSVGDALGSVSTSKMTTPEDEMNSSQTFWVVAETTINQSGNEEENTINQGFVSFEAASGTPLSSSSPEKGKVENLFVAEAAIDRSENELETRVDQELVNLETDFGALSSSSSTENQKVKISAVPEATINQSATELETIINQELMNLETNFRTGDSVVPPNDHMNTTTAGDLYLIEPEPRIPVPQQERNVDSVENVPQCSLPSPDTRYDEKKNEGFGLCKNLAEIAALSGKMDNDKSELVPKKMEETVPTEPTAHNGTLLSMADDGMSIHSVTPPSAVVSDGKPIDLTQAMTDAKKELESCSCNNLLLETDKINEGNGNLHPPSISSDFNIVDRPEVLVEDSKDHKDVRLTNCVVQDPHEGVSGLEDYFKDPIPKESYSTLEAEPFDQASEVASFDTKTVEERQIQENGVNSVLVDVKADCFRNSGQEVDENSIQEVNATQIEGILSEKEKLDKTQTLSDAANFGTDSIPSASFSPEVEPMAPSKNSLDYLSENVTEVLSDENSAAPTGNQKKLDDNEVGIGVLLADDENKAGACGKHSEDSVKKVHLPVDTHERKDNGVYEIDKFDNLDVAGAEDKKGRLEEKFSIGIDSTTPESTTNSRENQCSAVAEEIDNESPSKFSGIESVDSKSFDISLVSETQQSVKEDDHCGAVRLACISEAKGGDKSCHVRDFNAVQNSTDVQANKEANLVSVYNVSVTGRSDASQDGSVSQPFGDAVRITSETGQDDGVKTDAKPQLTSSLLDASVNATSRSDSLEGHWGSVSVLSTQSELPAAVDGEVTLQARAEAEGTDSKKTNAATERQHSNRSDLFEPPSFMTLVEPNGGGIQNSATSEIETARNRQQPYPASLQAGWFPSYTHVANDSPGRKKNEASIAKVTNWSTGKPHSALKNLLDDAALENKQKSSPTQKENLVSMIQKDEKMTKIDAVEPVTLTKSPTSQLGNKEIPNEWNSPARYPSDIRRERKKGKPYWAQFVCCSSVHQ